MLENAIAPAEITQGTFLVNVLSMVAAQLAQVILITGSLQEFVGAVFPLSFSIYSSGMQPISSSFRVIVSQFAGDSHRIVVVLGDGSPSTNLTPSILQSSFFMVITLMITTDIRNINGLFFHFVLHNFCSFG